ncbi:MAG: EamA family transporter [Candidatus Latescibacteria bacterium]|nr:EamA family transporter [Candidatus Latescibacterota bacterium]
MSLTAVLLLVPAALLHALWNMAGKRQRPSTAFFLLANTAAALLMSPVLVWHWDRLPAVPATVWQLALLTGFFNGGYYVALARAYRAGDLGIAYPLIRSIPALLITLFEVLRGKGEHFGPLYLGGIVLLLLGCFILPFRPGLEFRWSRYLDACCRWAGLGAVFIAGYTLIDSAAVGQLRSCGAFSNREAPLLYMVFQSTSVSLWLAAFGLVERRAEGAALRSTLQREGRTILLVGLGIYSCYGMVLASMAYVDNVGYVAAFRQLSIPVGALMGVWLLKEESTRNKVLGTLLIFAGLVMVGLG